MVIKKKMEAAINKQINAELYSGYLYFAMGANFETQNFKGFAQWMYVQAQEEYGHAMKLYKYVIDRGGKVTLEAIEKPKTEWATPQDAFEEAYAHEQKVTEMINSLVEVAKAENDNASQVMLQWFVNEQVEEEASSSEIVEKLKMIKGAPQGLFMMDHALGERKAG
ncbi:MAG TPA: ferritin [Spirochaetia bacterium]|nr:ferritin [Spirochaetia bacterium]